MKERIFQISIMLITVGLVLSNSLAIVTALDASNTTAIPSSGKSWTLKIDISPNNTYTLSLDDLYALPKTTVYAELSCYGKPIKSGLWGGVSLGLLLQKAGFEGESANLKFYAADGYIVPLSFTSATPKDVIIAYELDSSALDETLRLVIPFANGEAWIAMITEISINDPTYVGSPNPDAASIALQNHYLQPSLTPYSSPSPQTTPMPQTTPTPEIRDQPTPQPTVPPSTNQPVQQQQKDTSRSSLQINYGYPILIGVVIAATLTTGYLFHKRRN